MLKNIFKNIRKKFIPFSVCIICMYALYLRIMVLYRHTLWDDELFSLNLMKGTFLELLKVIPKVEYCSYMSGDLYLVYPFFKIFHYNNWGLAIPHIIGTVIGFYILYLICKRYFESIWAYFITFGVVCFNATLINHATELRIYSVLPTLALATFYLFQRIADLNFRLSIKKRVIASIFFVLVIWFHVYGILMFGSCFLFTLLSKYKENDFKTCLKNAISFIGVILGIAMPFWLYCVFGPHFGYTQQNIDPFKYIPSPLQNILGFLKGIICNLVGSKKLYFLFLGVIIPFIFSYKDRYKQLLFLFLNIVAPVGVIFFLDIAGEYYFLQRQFIWVMPLFAFFLGWVWDSFTMFLKRDSIKIDK